ncbi:MAG: hypothetical protein JWM31_658 [Solirubrobacterales bacterium]|nr:hypothetical protein [Solirubrobacterales bacterium]
MIIAGVLVICVVLALLAFLMPRLSRHPQRGVSKTLGGAANAAGSAPGPIGRFLRKPFDTSNRAANKSAGKGREARDKLPL